MMIATLPNTGTVIDVAQIAAIGPVTPVYPTWSKLEAGGATQFSVIIFAQNTPLRVTSELILPSGEETVHLVPKQLQEDRQVLLDTWTKYFEQQKP